MNFEKNTRLGSVYRWHMCRPEVIYELVTGSPSGSYYHLPDDEKKRVEEKTKKLSGAMYYSGILWFDCNIIPAPFLEDEFIEKLAPPKEIKPEEEIEIKVKIGEEEKVVKIAAREGKEFEGKKPDWRILEEIVKDVLKSMGFDERYIELEKRLPARGGGTIEVDVWAWKWVGNTRFYVYASCKNWEREVDRRVIDEEFGRTQQLNQIPHLKIFIAKRLTEPARQAALADGFIVIELGEKASSENAREIYEIIANHLRNLFIGIAPPELQKFAKEAKEISERLKSLAEEIERISS